jgi:hypothetical protein
MSEHMSNRRELYRSPNGDSWFLARDVANGRAHVLHEPNIPSGGRPSRIELSTFFANGARGPEQQALLRLSGRLVEDASPALSER